MKKTLLVMTWLIASNTSLDFEFLDSSHGKEFVLYDFRIKDQVFFRSLNTTSLCSCRNACKVSPLCQTVSMNIENRKIDCRLSAYQIYSLGMEAFHGAFTYAKAHSWTHWFGKDGMFYFVSSRLAPLEEQRRYCQSFTQGRLLTLKSRAQARSFHKFLSEKFWDGISFIVDLEDDTRDNLVWGDGTNLYDTDLWGTIDLTELWGVTESSAANSVYKVVLRGSDIEIRRDYNNLSSWHACQINPFYRL